MKSKIPVYAWYFPNWHPDPRNDIWHGKNWTEWQCVKHAAKRFEDHIIYKPLWGYEDESDPLVMEKKIDTALSYGIDGFLWDFYWFDDDFGEGESVGSYRLGALDKGFFGAHNNEKFKIALMWCNHDPIYVHPASYRNVARSLIPGELSLQAFYNGSQYMIKHYFWRENYLRIDNKIYFILWHVPKFINGMGGIDGARIALEDFRNRVRKAGLGELYIATVPAQIPDFNQANRDRNTKLLVDLGIDGCCTYGWPSMPKNPEEETWPKFLYSKYVDNGIETFERLTNSVDLPVNITVSQGWDSSPRTVPSDMYDDIGSTFRWITDKKNPEDFERGLCAAKAYYESNKFTGHFITLTTWNEWTEGNFMEPSVQDGFAYLEAVKRVFVDKNG
ncbi:MAG: glycoside hydrolase family 99-like domain-containing protein [Christensenellales bacterium]|jgi:hypothetical protein